MLLLVFLVVFVSLIHAIPIDNGLVGEPEIQCGPRSIIVTFNTENTFDGKVYAKNHFVDQECIAFPTGRDLRGTIELGFEDCNARRERSLNPRGIFVSVNVVISFHKTVLTKIDRAFRIQCFYMEADKTVSQDIEVSMLTTSLQTQTVPMPVCRYDILDGGPNGQPVRFALIGQQVYHKWTCDSDTDGAEDVIELLDDDGCSLDKYLLGNLEYPTDLMAGREAHVFKYADRPTLDFNCQIRITVKEPGSECERPQCSSSSSNRRRRPRRQRSARDEGEIQDVSIPRPMMVADVGIKEKDVPNYLFQSHHQSSPNTQHVINDYCISSNEFLLVCSVCALLFVSSLSFFILIWCKMAK